MGMNDRIEKKRSKRGSTDNASRLAAFGGSSDRPAARADWGECSPEMLAAVVIRLTQLGGALTFGLSRDGGAYMLTLMLDGDRRTLWFNGDADLDAELNKVWQTLDGMG